MVVFELFSIIMCVHMYVYMYVKGGLVLMHRSIDPRTLSVITEPILHCRVRSRRQ